MANVRTRLTQEFRCTSRANQPTSSFVEKTATISLTVIKRRHGFAAMEQLTDGG